MLQYIINSGLCLSIFYVFYKLILEKEKNHRLKRFYLLAILLLSFGIPFVTFTTYIEIIPKTFIEQSVEILNFEVNKDIMVPIIEKNYTPIILWTIYLFGVILFSLKFIYNLINIYFRIISNKKHQYKKFTHVLLQELMAPHTFFNYIFFNQNNFEANDIPKEVHLHEQAHATQKHSLDILIIEILKIVFWFNPLIYFIKHSIKLNHEFLADQAVLNHGINPKTYQEILLSFTYKHSHLPLSNAINYSSIKKRFTVMKTPTSKNKLWVKSILIVPLTTLLILGFSQKETVGKETVEKEVQQNQEINASIETNENEGVSEELMNEYKNFMQVFKKENMIDGNKYDRIMSIHDLMSDDQRNSVEKYPIAPFSDFTRTKPKKPTVEQYESWKNSKEFALWLDDRVIKNTELNNYKISDIYHFFGSSVMNNARSERFPQPFQFHLYTEKHFENTIVKSNLNTYNRLLKTYNEDLNNFLKSNRNDNSELKILKIQIDKLNNNFSEEEIEKWAVKLAPPVPSTKKVSKNTIKNFHIRIETSNDEIKLQCSNGSAWKELKFTLPNGNEQAIDEFGMSNTFDIDSKNDSQLANYKFTIKKSNNTIYLKSFEGTAWTKLSFGLLDNEIQFFNEMGMTDIPMPPRNIDEGSEILVKEYNKWAHKINKNPNSIIKLKDFNRMEYTYSLMSPKQKNKAEKFPKMPPLPPPAKPEIKIHKSWSDVPPPPPPEKQEIKKFKSPNDVPPPPASKTSNKGYIKINGKEHYFITNNNKTKYWDRNGSEVDENGKVIHSNVLDIENKDLKLLKTWYITIDNVKYYYTNKNISKKYYTKDGFDAKLDIIKEYNRKIEALEHLKNNGKHYVFKTKDKQKKMKTLYSDLGGMYFRMTNSNKSSVKRPTGYMAPYIKITKKNGEVYYKKRKELNDEDKKLLPSFLFDDTKQAPPPPPKKKTNSGN